MRNLGLFSFFIIVGFLEGCSSADAPKSSPDHNDLKYFLRQATVLNSTDSGHYFSLPLSPFLNEPDTTCASYVSNRIEVPDSIANKYFISAALNESQISPSAKYIDYIEHAGDFTIVYCTYDFNIDKAVTYAIVLNKRLEYCSRLIISTKDNTFPGIIYQKTQTLYRSGTYNIEIVSVSEEYQEMNHNSPEYREKLKAEIKSSKYILDSAGRFKVVQGSTLIKNFGVKSVKHDNKTGFTIVE